MERMTTGLNWLQGSRKERKDRGAAILRACSELNAAAEAVITFGGVLKGLQPPPCLAAAEGGCGTGLRPKPPVDPFAGEARSRGRRPRSAPPPRLSPENSRGSA